MTTDISQIKPYSDNLVELMVDENRTDVLKKLAMIYSVASPVFGVDNPR